MDEFKMISENTLSSNIKAVYKGQKLYWYLIIIYILLIYIFRQ